MTPLVPVVVERPLKQPWVRGGEFVTAAFEGVFPDFDQLHVLGAHEHERLGGIGGFPKGDGVNVAPLAIYLKIGGESKAAKGVKIGGRDSLGLGNDEE